jgi:hypothetical protein
MVVQIIPELSVYTLIPMDMKGDITGVNADVMRLADCTD